MRAPSVEVQQIILRFLTASDKPEVDGGKNNYLDRTSAMIVSIISFYGDFIVYLCSAVKLFASILLTRGLWRWNVILNSLWWIIMNSFLHFFQRSTTLLMAAVIVKGFLLVFQTMLLFFGFFWILPVIFFNAAKIVVIYALCKIFKGKEEVRTTREWNQSVISRVICYLQSAICHFEIQQ